MDDDEEAARGGDPFGPGTRFGRWDPGARGVRVIAVVVLVVAVGAAVVAWRARPQAEVIAAPAPAVSADAPGGSASPAGEVVVAVAGKVRSPGMVRLPPGARVADALAAAGGALPGVDTALLNLARKVTDGELIVIGASVPPAAPGVVPPAPGAAGGLVNLNTATLADLDGLPGVGPVLAQRILEHRDRIGGFRAVSDLREVEGIGDSRYEQLKDLVTL
ncbi:ComEA family DNA-binding protein [Catenuloplanes indicus]|uniref:Competence protein ComEA n=1 Tax=Catenuloplanes indicus TaxID=137267 RepID=A0AAE4AWT1_9ACTN|nr:helix-hairpin-helix domain-containing protein [Catenuloplanes indicus]MDQ0366285.1 competence protein ComEA [Catenuloplanes indicus]